LALLALILPAAQSLFDPTTGSLAPGSGLPAAILLLAPAAVVTVDAADHRLQPCSGSFDGVKT
jgi:hypothetical protein